MIKEYGVAPDTIDTAYKLSHDYERRIKFQADIQDYVDMSISSTINLPAWDQGTITNRALEHLLVFLLDMHQDSAVSLVTLTEVEEVNPSQK